MTKRVKNDCYDKQRVPLLINCCIIVKRKKHLAIQFCVYGYKE